MIAFVRGVIEHVGSEAVIVDIGGLGYEVYCTPPCLQRLHEGESVKLYTHHHIREDSAALYGFLSPGERDLFVQLQTVSGIGPRAAITLLGAGDAMKLCRAIETGDVKFLVSLPGIGQKTAGRIILELKGKLPSEADHAVAQPAIGGLTGNSVASDVVAALMTLGYNEKEATGAVRERSNEIEQGDSLESILRLCLRELQRA